MPDEEQNDVVRYTEIVDASPAVAFHAFVERLGDWWPASYTFFGDRLAYIGLEPSERGRCVELDVDDEELVWGEVRAFEPPARVVFGWWVQPDRTLDPARDSEVEARFIDERSLTRVEFGHRDLARHGDGWRQMRDALASRQGWPLLLQMYADFANQ